MDPTFTVSSGAKRKTGISRGKLLELATKNKLPPQAFLRPDDDTEDWQEICTVSWLGDVATRTFVLRHCVQCDTRLKISREGLHTLKQCPDCATPSQFVDYLANETDVVPNVPVEPWGKYDFVVFAFAGVFAFVGLFAAIALVFNPPLAVLFGFVMLAAASGLFFVTWQHRSESSKYRTHLTNVEDVLARRTKLLSDRSARLRALERSLGKIRDDIVQVTSAECQKRLAEADFQLDLAKENAGAVDRIAGRYLDEQRKWWTQKLKGDNFHLQKERIQKAVQFAEKQGYPVSPQMRAEVFEKLEADYKQVLRKEAEQARQRQIREQIRSEQKAEREAREAAKRAEDEQRLIQEALNDALAAAGAEHSAEVEELQRQLLEAEERGKRAVSQAQLTKVGHVYVISNVGSFGEGTYKVGLTRRLEPLDRVKELGDASVPFPFDVHAMIFSEDAPALEHALHKALHRFRVNRVNMRKEFFRIDLDTIIAEVERQHGTVEYVIDAEALDYRIGQGMSDEEFEFIGDAAEEMGIDLENDEN